MIQVSLSKSNKHWNSFVPHCNHTAAVARDGPAGKKTAYKAKDVWAFFDKTGGHSVCMICK